MDYNPPPKPETTAVPPAEWNSPDHAGYTGQEHLPPAGNVRFKHSGPGIASFVIAMLTLAGYIFTFVYIGVQAAAFIDDSRPVNDALIAGSPEIIMFAGVSVLLLAAINVIGTIIGIIGLTLRSRRKVFAIIGTIINAVILLIFMLLIASVLVNAGAV
ncbi:hypothetical protein [Paenibacillus sp. MMS20-IR301]|uniref:hypothetical protein n=1 Tax=Paenibacillus sp. MMS20-IR301 TaxID=2895946 RepID=UPI0028F12389|nr:hypothetical protein [Paenibacillus sp. MMS20-IR301]WNS46470.1 hypothetical protein LOS79_14815 [Paenibacillus sp. MMS20-IR301]